MITKKFPSEETFGLVSQIRRASISVPSNIVEGASKRSKKEYLKFLYDAKASLKEVEYQMELSRELKYVNEEDYKAFDALFKETISVLQGLLRSVENEV